MAQSGLEICKISSGSFSRNLKPWVADPGHSCWSGPFEWQLVRFVDAWGIVCCCLGEHAWLAPFFGSSEAADVSTKRIIAVPSATGELRKMGAAAHFRLSWRLDNPGNSLVLCLYTGTLNPFNGCLHELMFGLTLDTSDKSLTSRFSMQFGVAKWGLIFFGVPLSSFSFWGGSLIAKGFALGFNLTSNSILGIHPTSDSC